MLKTKKNEMNYCSSSFSSSEVLKIFTFDCILNAFSSDHIAQFKDNANAKYGSSFFSSPCGEILLASDINFLYSFSETGSTLRKIKEDFSFDNAWVYDEHDHSKPPVGRVIDMEIIKMKDGEYALEGKSIVIDKQEMKLISEGKKTGVSIAFTVSPNE